MNLLVTFPHISFTTLQAGFLIVALSSFGLFFLVLLKALKTFLFNKQNKSLSLTVYFTLLYDVSLLVILFGFILMGMFVIINGNIVTSPGNVVTLNKTAEQGFGFFLAATAIFMSIVFILWILWDAFLIYRSKTKGTKISKSDTWQLKMGGISIETRVLKNGIILALGVITALVGFNFGLDYLNHAGREELAIVAIIFNIVAVVFSTVDLTNIFTIVNKKKTITDFNLDAIISEVLLTVLFIGLIVVNVGVLVANS